MTTAVDTTEGLRASLELQLPPPRLRRDLRKLAQRTQEDVAAEFGVSDGAVSYWERFRPGRRHMRGYLRLLLDWADGARAMGLPVSWPSPPGSESNK